MTKLTEEQKENRHTLRESIKQDDDENGRSRIRIVNPGDPDFKYRAFTLFDDTEVAQGGWCYGKWMTAKYLKDYQKRWVQRSFTTGQEEPDYDKENDWIPHQCGGCRWFAALDLDYGFCCNLQSPNEGRITFEHGGCPVHSDYSH